MSEEEETIPTTATSELGSGELRTTLSLEFKRYQSINNATEKLLEKILAVVPSDETWVGMEKIHGTNMSVYTSITGQCIFASRRQFLNEEESKFYGFFESPIRHEMESKCRALLSNLDHVQHSIVVYGELFGGEYPKLERPNHVSPVQREVLYSPTLEFKVFDIMIDEEWLPFDEYRATAQLLGLRYCDALIEGSLEHCLSFDVESFESLIPAELGLLPPPGNYAEGLVLRPKRAYMVGPSRAILKHKRSTFSDKQKPIKRVGLRLPEISQQAQEIVNEVAQYINTNTVSSVVSHGNRTDRRKLAGLVIRDALSTAVRDDPDLQEAMAAANSEGKQRKAIHNALSVYATQAVQDYLASQERNNT